MSIQCDAIQSSHPLSSPSPPAQSFPAPGSFPMSRFFTSGGQSIRSHQVSTPGGLGSGSYFSLYPRVPDMNWMHLEAFKVKERQRGLLACFHASVPSQLHACPGSCLADCSWVKGFPGGSDGKESARNAGDLGSIHVLGRSPGGGNGYPLQYSCLENPCGRRSEPGELQSMGLQRARHD